MDPAENRKSLALGVPGIVLQILGNVMYRSGGTVAPMGQTPVKGNPLWLLVALAGTVLLIAGLSFYAKAKGRSPAWGLMGLLSIIGLIVLACLKDLSPQRKA
jgi:hypothetical protein